MYGLEIKVENKYEKYIYKLLKNTNVEGYIWQINSDDIIIKAEHGNIQGLFNEKMLDGFRFLDIIEKYNYYLIFADCKAFKSRDTIKEISNGVDMVQSECDLVFMCTDSTNIEIYCKDKDVYDTIKLNCNDIGGISFCDVDDKEINSRSMIAF